MFQEGDKIDVSEHQKARATKVRLNALELHGAVNRMVLSITEVSVPWVGPQIPAGF